jgi:rSAM/selenodomain-associated transferase 1
MNGASEKCVLFFVKYPAVGRAKTRLAKQLGRKVASDLYKNFVTDILATLNNLKVNLRIFFDPPDAEKQFQFWLGEEYSYVPQIGHDLGQRMKNAFLQAFGEGFKRVIIIGSDIPDLPAYYFDLAFDALDTNDAVVGPSSDGGYYLIGFVKDAFSPEVFNGISWSSDSVFDQTVDILKQYGRKLYLLPQWYDVDTLADLESLLQRNKNTTFTKSATICYINQNKLADKFNVRL